MSRGRPTRVAVDFRCQAHDKRMGVLWLDVREEPHRLYTRVPGGGEVPASGQMHCPVRECPARAEVQPAQVLEWLGERAATFGPGTPFVWPIWADQPAVSCVQ